MEDMKLEHMKLVLVEAILDLAGFLDFSDEDSTDPDIATKELENLSATLKQLTSEERQEFLRYTQEVARIKEQMGADKGYIEWILSFGTYSGLVEDQSELTEEELKDI